MGEGLATGRPIAICATLALFVNKASQLHQPDFNISRNSGKIWEKLKMLMLLITSSG